MFDSPSAGFHYQQCICTFPCEHGSPLLCWEYGQASTSPPTHRLILSFRPHVPTRWRVGDIHLQRIAIVNDRLREQQWISAYQSHIQRLFRLENCFLVDRTRLKENLLAIDGGINISFANVPFTLTFHKLMPGIPCEPSLPGLPVLPRGPPRPRNSKKINLHTFNVTSWGSFLQWAIDNLEALRIFQRKIDF